jgi:CheY-like chemotaxis protein
MSKPTTQNGNVRILIIDDEPLIRKTAARTLDFAHEVITAEHGKEALELLDHDNAFDVVVTDICMPEADGWEVYSTIRQKHPHLADRVVFWSGGVTESRRKSIEATGNPYLQKPVDPAQLLEVIELLVAITGDLEPMEASP